MICDAKSIFCFLYELNNCYEWFKANYIIQILAYLFESQIQNVAYREVPKEKYYTERFAFHWQKVSIILLILATEVVWIKQSNDNVPSRQMSEINPGTLAHLKRRIFEKLLTAESRHLNLDLKTLPQYLSLRLIKILWQCSWICLWLHAPVSPECHPSLASSRPWGPIMTAP